MPSTSEMPAWWPHPPLDHAAFTERLHRSVNGHSSGGFAVAYTDKGTGIGAHDLDRNTVQLINGECASADALGQAAHFSAKLSTEERAAYARDWPHHFAFKHAHSERNPEQYWGEDVLRAIRFALHVLNLHLGGTPGRPAITRSSTLVIASGISNGGAAPRRFVQPSRTGSILSTASSSPNRRCSQSKTDRGLVKLAHLGILVISAAVIGASPIRTLLSRLQARAMHGLRRGSATPQRTVAHRSSRGPGSQGPQ